MKYFPEALKLLVNFFYQDWQASKTSYERTSMLKSASVVRKISIGCTVLTQTMLTIYIVLRISIIVRFQRNDPARPLVYTAYFPFDVTRSPIFELVCVGQILSAYSATVSYTGSDSFISMLVLHVCGQFQNLREKLKNLADHPDGVKTVEGFRNELAQIVKRHEHLNWCVIAIDNVKTDFFHLFFNLSKHLLTVVLYSRYNSSLNPGRNNKSNLHRLDFDYTPSTSLFLLGNNIIVKYNIQYTVLTLLSTVNSNVVMCC